MGEYSTVLFWAIFIGFVLGARAMSRLCRLKTKTHGEDGQWAYEEITKLREQVAAQAAVIEKLREALIAGWSLQCEFYDARQLADDALALSTDSTQILAEVRRAERERVAQMFEESGIGGDHLAAAIRAME